MGDVRYERAYRLVKAAGNRAPVIHDLTDEEVIAALAAASKDGDAFLANILATAAMNRLNRSRAITMHLGEGTLAVTPEGRLTFVNPAMACILGGGWQDHVGKDMDDVFTIRDVDGTILTGTSACPMRRAIETRSPVELDAELQPRRGPALRVSIIAAPILRDDAVEGGVAAFRDITDRLRAERANEESRKRLQAILDQIPVGILIAEAPSGRIVFHNRHARRLLAHPIPDVPDHSAYACFRAIHPDGTPYAADEYPIARSLLHREVVEQEEMLYRAGDGRTLTLSTTSSPVRDEEGNLVVAVTSFTDVTSDVEARRRLAQSEERYRCLYDLNPLAVFTLDAQGVLTGVNPAGERMIGYGAGQIVGRHFLDFLAPGQEEKALARFARVLGGEVRHDAYDFVRKDGRTIRARVTGVPIRTNGESAGMHGVAEDITPGR